MNDDEKKPAAISADDEAINQKVAELRAEKKPGIPIANDDESAVCTAAGWEKAFARGRQQQAKNLRTKPDVHNAKLWLVTMVGEIPPFQAFQSIAVEAEQWFDARRAASTMIPGVLRVEEVKPGSIVHNFQDMMLPRRRIQVRWVGRTPHLHLECRLVDPNAKDEEKGLLEWHRV